mmetsp:Transcript_9050/g.16408  ORF Transcript_9050/g.16408 Transcript_9050/m.16408 type:complete len:569 (-) Transcript_9050:166-1872(-)|eukprot:CAMPEP_0182495974 /NCGR_PEP_ID=MMETSP1321-20130603/4672_1 /TAXON_ID=91990 /ORGANISM="Bolidomonas sp., Strain RCC1657" /LENGTH=568 /DNA_ID=CAMNT_0024699467 /DNA_START=203 /DNA_END=1909 /DNA_ORIENTATION=+
MPSRTNRVASLPALFPEKGGNLKRRKQSVFELLGVAHEPAIPAPIRKTTSFRSDYRDLRTSEERIEKALQLFYTQVHEAYVEDPKMESVVEETKAFVAAQVLRGLTPAEADDLKYAIMNKLATELKDIDHYKVMKTFGKTLLSYFDIITDILVLVDLIKRNSRMAVVQGISLGVSFSLQSIVSLACGQPIWVVLSGLLGLKPAIESWRDATRAKPFPKQKMDNDVMLMMSRMTEVLSEAIPQSLVQTLVVVMYPDQRTTVQFVSLFASFLTTGFVVASSDREMDLSKYRRKSEPLLFGYVPDTNSHKQMTAFVSFFSLYKLAKVSSLALLISASSFRYAVILLTLEFFGFLGWRMVYQNWRFYKRGLDGKGFSLFVHFGWYICLLSAPFPMTRVPAILTPRIYAGGLLYMLSVNFTILVFSYQVFDASAYLSQTEAWTGLSTITFLCLVSWGIALYYVPGSHKATFYKSLTFKEHVATYWWNGCRYCTDHKNKITTDQQYIRAMISFWCSKQYTSYDKIVTFYKDNWKDWCADPPDWFDEEFKSLVPEDLLAVVGETGGSSEEQKEEA